MRTNRMNDLLFKHVFGRPERKDVLLSLVNAVLNDGADKPDVIKDLELTDRELDPKNSSEKGYRLDILGKAADGTIVNIEVQTTNKRDIYKRSLCYWARLYGNQLDEGKPYSKLRPTIMINLLGFRYFEGAEYHNQFEITNRRTGKPENDDLQIHFIELPKWEILSRKAENRLERWLAFLSNRDPAEVEDIVMRDATVKNAFEAEKAFLSSETARYLYDLREKADRDHDSEVYSAKEEGRQEGRQKGRQEGREEERIQTVEKLLAEKVSVALIQRVTGLPVESIEEIRGRLNAGARNRD